MANELVSEYETKNKPLRWPSGMDAQNA
jgi:hypothetical protein